MTKQELERKKKLLEQYTRLQELPIKAKTEYAAYVDFTHKARFTLGRFQIYICETIDKFLKGELLNDKGKPFEGLTISVPPQHGKSMCVTETLPSYYLGKNPYDHVIEVSYGDDLAQKFGRRNKGKIEEVGGPLFGIQISSEKASTVDFEIEKTKGGMLSRGIGGGLSGNPGDLIIIDDPYKNRQDADSASYNKFVIDEWLNVIRMRASAKCKYIVIHTRWNEDDLIGYLLDNEPDKWFEIRFPIEAEEYEPTTRRQPGDPLLPEAGKDKEWVQNLKTSFLNDPSQGGVRAWNALMQQRPTSLEGNMIKREYWKRYDLTLEMQKQGFFPVKIQSWDCSFKDTDGTDPVAGQVWGKINASYYMIDHKGGRMDIVKTLEGVLDFTNKHPDAIAKLVEDKANGPAVIRLLQGRIHGLIPIQATKSKAERVNAVLPLWIAGNVYIPKRIEVEPGVFVHCDWAEAIIEQCAGFKPEKKVQRDDEVDSASQALNWLMYTPAVKAGQPEKYDTFLHGEKPQDPFNTCISQSFINYGM